jgi:hypothetical protein
VQFIGVERLLIDRSYQRGTQSKNSQRLIGDRREMGLAAVHSAAGRERDGGLYIIDGQHRWEAAKLRGDIQFMPCAVGNYTGSAEEAALFVAANRHRVRVNPMDMWRAAVAAGDEATVTLDRLVTAAGLSIARTPQHQAAAARRAALHQGALHGAPDPRRRQAGGAGRTSAGVQRPGDHLQRPDLRGRPRLLHQPARRFRSGSCSTTRSARARPTNGRATPRSPASARKPAAAALRKVMLEVMAMLEDDDERRKRHEPPPTAATAPASRSTPAETRRPRSRASPAD